MATYKDQTVITKENLNNNLTSWINPVYFGFFLKEIDSKILEQHVIKYLPAELIEKFTKIQLGHITIKYEPSSIELFNLLLDAPLSINVSFDKLHYNDKICALTFTTLDFDLSPYGKDNIHLTAMHHKKVAPVLSNELIASESSKTIIDIEPLSMYLDAGIFINKYNSEEELRSKVKSNIEVMDKLTEYLEINIQLTE
jgi:hypothetical protein